jgi:hypothetical protein
MPSRNLAAILIVPLLAALVLTLFAWPAARLEPRDLPVGVAGAPAGARAIEQRLATQEGAYDIHRYPDEGAARQAIREREVYGAFVSTPSGPELLTASAASASVAQLLVQTAESAPGPAPKARDVVPSSDNDPRGAALSASVLPLAITGLLTGVAASFLAPAGLRRVGLVAAASVLAGVAATAIVQGWLGVVGGDWAANWAALSLTVVAIASVVAGLQSLVGRAGIFVGAATMIVVGNALSAVSSAPEMLPQPVGAIGQLLPPGAGGNLVRSTGFFDGAGAGKHLAVLIAWVLVGLTALVTAAARDRRRASVLHPAGDREARGGDSACRPRRPAAAASRGGSSIR